MLAEENNVTAQRPDTVPAKFWDSAKGEVRVDALLRAYRELERFASSQPRSAAAPASHEEYCIQCRHPSLASSPEVNRRLHAAGFSQEQAQLVYDLAHDCLLPVLDELMARHEQESHMGELKRHFGGESQWKEHARQIKAWGEANLPKEAYKALSSTADGVKTMYRLMVSEEPSLGAALPANEEARSEEQLKKMISDPRYWKTKDPAFIAKVSDGFRRLYGE